MHPSRDINTNAFIAKLSEFIVAYFPDKIAYTNKSINDKYNDLKSKFTPEDKPSDNKKLHYYVDAVYSVCELASKSSQTISLSEVINSSTYAIKRLEEATEDLLLVLKCIQFGFDEFVKDNK